MAVVFCLQCTNYDDEPGTADSGFYIRMGGGDGCCVQKHTRSLQGRECGPEQTYVHNPDYNYNYNTTKESIL